MVESTDPAIHRVGHKILAVTGVTWGVFLGFLIPPSISFQLCGMGRTAAPSSGGSSTGAPISTPLVSGV